MSNHYSAALGLGGWVSTWNMRGRGKSRWIPYR